MTLILCVQNTQYISLISVHGASFFVIYSYSFGYTQLLRNMLYPCTSPQTKPKNKFLQKSTIYLRKEH